MTTPTNPTPTPERPYYAEDTETSDYRWVIRSLDDIRIVSSGLNKEEAEKEAKRLNDAHAAALETKRLADEAPRLAAENKLMRDALEKAVSALEKLNASVCSQVLNALSAKEVRDSYSGLKKASDMADKASSIARATLAKLEARP